MHRHHRFQQLLVWMFALLALGVIIFVRLRLLSVPLERDEGEFAYAGQLLLQGILPFESIYNMKMPGIYVAYAAMMAFLGRSSTAIHLGLMITNLATMALVFQVGSRISGRIAGVVAAICYGLMSLHFSVQGVFGHATHFVVLFAMAGILAIFKGAGSLRKDVVFAGGLLLGTGFMMKQHGMAFIVYAGLILLRMLSADRRVERGQKTRIIAVFTAGVVIPFSVTCGVLWTAGLFDTFWFWTVSYATRYVTMVPIQSGLETLWQNLSFIICSSPIFWALAIVGGLFSAMQKRLGGRINLLGWLTVFSFISIFPGFHFRPHYFVLMLPAVSLLAGTGVARLCEGPDTPCCPPANGGFRIWDVRHSSGVLQVKRYAPLVLLFIALCLSLIRNDGYYFWDTPEDVSHKTYPAQFFPESLKISDYIQKHCKKNDTIAVLGSEPQIYVYADRRSATGYIYMFPLMEIQDYALQMQRQMAREIEASKPVFIVFFSSQPSWVVRPQSERWIFGWLEGYKEKYRPVGVVDFIAPDQVAYVWGGPAADYRPASPIWCMILKRIDAME
ncbi:MAG: glycosyltransferase family 39 protein [Desulfobacterales bacterium]|nr:glycosyltransferase family 39 protein [Desulfobacterales bacterium]